MKIQIKEHHIKNGTRNCCHICPVALALLEHLNLFTGVSVGVSCACTPKGNFLIPPATREFIYRFDNNLEIHPCELELLEVPQSLNKEPAKDIYP